MIKLGPNNEAAAEEALATWPGGLQIGGGITIDNAKKWLSKGASKARKKIHSHCLARSLGPSKKNPLCLVPRFLKKEEVENFLKKKCFNHFSVKISKFYNLIL